MLNDTVNPLSIAPMMAFTDRYYRYFLRLITKEALLYTEMITTDAILHGDKNRLLGFDSSEHPIAVQLGGFDPKHLAECAKICEEYGYDEINLNVGCPSDRVKNGSFGACLMSNPELVRDCVAAMIDEVKIPVTVKCRIGIDELDSYEYFSNFVSTVAESGCKTFIVHARKAWLNGLSPKENREVPPLDYERVKRLKDEYPELNIIVNGGIRNHDDIDCHLQTFDGVMLGRTVLDDPYILSEIDKRYFNSDSQALTRDEIATKYLNYLENELSNGTKYSTLARHLVNLFHGQPGARNWRRTVSDTISSGNYDTEVLHKAVVSIGTLSPV